MRAQRGFDLLHCLSIHFRTQFHRYHGGDPSPFSIGFVSQRFVIQLDLTGCFKNRRGSFTGPAEIAGRVLVGCGDNIDAGLVGATPRLFEAKKVAALIKPAVRERHAWMLTPFSFRQRGVGVDSRGG